MADEELDGLFATLRARPPEPKAALVARMEADALAVQAEAAPRRAPVAAPVRERGLVARWADALGGALGLAGLATAALAGLWIGVVQPSPVSGVTGLIEDRLGLGTDEGYVDLSAPFDVLAAEG